MPGWVFISRTNNFLPKNCFSSNLKSLVSLDGEYKIDKNSLIEYLDLGVVTSPKTIFSNIYKLKPAEIITFNFENKEIKSEKIIGT